MKSIGIVIGCLVVIALGDITIARSIKLKAKQQENIRAYRAYNQGYWDGMNETIKFICIDTNTGKRSIELTNMLNALTVDQKARGF